MSGDNVYQDADIVWVKLGSSWWPGEVCGLQRQPEGFLQQAKRKPYCVVKFFQEDSFECVKTSKHILPFNCSKKDEFIRKGHELFKAKKKFMEKFPSDVSTAERLTRSVMRSSLFFNSRPDSIVKAILGESPQQSDRNRNGKRCDNVTKIINITPNRNYVASPSSNSPPTYKCSMCDFQSTRQNVMVLHRKSHSGTAATVSRRNSLINSSTMTSSTESEARNSSSSRTVAVGTSSPLLETVNCQTPVCRKTSTAPLNDTIVDDVYDSESSSDEQKQYDSSAVILEKQKPHMSTTEQSSCSPKVNENASVETICKENARKSEEIHKSLLADWIDEDKDDEEDDSHQDKVEKYTNVAEVQPQVTLKAPPPIAQELSMHKPSPKIRNIPKKDRRNIVFTDFNSSDEIINLDASSQQSSEDARQLEKSLIESLSPAIENSYVKPCLVELNAFESENSGANIVPQSPPAVEISSATPSTTDTHSFNDDQSQSIKEPYDVDEKVYLPATVEPFSTEDDAEVTENTPIEDSLTTEPCTIKLLEAEAATTKSITVKTVEHPVVELSNEKLSTVTPSEENAPEDLITAESLPSNEEAATAEPTAVSSTVDKEEPPAKTTSPMKSPRKGKSSRRISRIKRTVGSSNSCKIIIKTQRVESTPEQMEMEPCTSKQLHSPEPSAINEAPQVDQYEIHESTVEPEPSTEGLLMPDMNEVSDIPSVVEESPEEPPAEAHYTNLSVKEPMELSSENAYTMETSTGPTEIQAENASNHSNLVVPPSEEIPVAEKSPAEPSINENYEISSAKQPAEETPAVEPSVEHVIEAEPSDEHGSAMNPPDGKPTPAGQHVVESTNVPGTLDTTTEQKLVDVKSFNSVSKGSLSCFDFQEEDDADDILTSIAKFKKKYISPEKGHDFGRDSRPKTPDAQKLEMELKDNQLSADIESLLNTTKLTVELATPSHVKQRSVLHEVRTLPIKERGKRIFKSRNRNRVDSCSSVSTTSMVKVAIQSRSPPQSTDCNIAQSCLPATSNDAEQSHNSNKTDLVTDELHSQNRVNNEVEAMDDKVTNSEEEIVGRIVFSPSEVFAPSAENFSSQSPDHRESHVSSSSIVVHPQPISESNESGYANQNISKSSDNEFATFDVVVTESQIQQTENTGNRTEYIFSRQADNIVVEEVQREHDLEGSDIVGTKGQTESSGQLELIFPLPHTEQDVVVDKACLEQEAERPNHKEDISTVVAESQTLNTDSCDVEKDNLPHPQIENSLDKEVFPQQEQQTEQHLVEIGDLMSGSHPEYIVALPEKEQQLQVDHYLVDVTTQHVGTCDMEEDNQPEYPLLHPQIESSVDKKELLQQEAQSEAYLKEIAITETEHKAQSADIRNVDEDQAIVVPLETENDTDAQEFLQQEVQAEEDQLNDFFVVEDSEPVYEVEIYDAEGSCKPSDNNYDESNTEYELITTEVTSIVDRISNDEEATVSGENTLENFKSGSVPEVSEVVVRSSDEGHFFKEIIQADSNQQPLSNTDVNEAELRDSNTSEGVDNSCQYFIMASETTDNEEGPFDESNSLLATENQSKNSVHEKDVERVEALEDESIPAGEGSMPAETSSDETVISDAEAEFGSPTSMLEEERMLSRCRSESMTPVTNMESINNNPKSKPTVENVLKKTPQWTRSQLLGCRRDRRLLVQSLQYDTQESASNDVELNSTNEREHDKEAEECEVPERRFSKTGVFTNEKPPAEREVEPDGTNNPASNKEDTLDSASESESDEEEISSPPIESLQDESGDSEAFEPCLTTDSGPGDTVSSSKDDRQFEEEAETSNENEDKTQPSTNSDTENNTNQQSPATFVDQISKSNHEVENQTSASYSSEEKEATNQTPKSSFYTITQKTDTIIRLNKYSERPDKSEADSETLGHENKPEIDGEELSAAEALLLIPNQPSNVFDSQELSKTASPMLPDSATAVDESSAQIKEEIMENDTVAEIPKEIVRRKRRSHMKVTPRKHIADVQKAEKSIEAELPHAKIAKLSQKSTVAQISDTHRKTFAEQYEENFVLKYMKEQSMEEADSVGSTNSATTESAKSPVPVEKQTTPEKVHITVDISNPLSSQIASILGTNRSAIEEDTKLGGARKRKQTLEDDIPSFIIKRPSPKTVAEAEAADRETIAQIQTLCPHVEITRKLSKDEQSSMLHSQPSAKPQILNQQILRAGITQPIITVTQKSNVPEEGVFDITTMPIVLSNEAIMNDKLHLVITPTTNPQVIKQFQNQQHLLSGNTSGETSSSAAVNVTHPGIPIRRMSNVRTKRTPSRQQLQEQQQQSRQLQSQEQINQQQYSQQQALPQLSLQQQYHQQHHEAQQQLQQQQLHQQNLQLQQQQQQQQQQPIHQSQQPPIQQQQRQHQQAHLVQQQHQFQQQQHFQQQFQLHHQNQMQQQLQEEQQFLIQQHQQQQQQQLLLQQQLQLQQQQQQEEQFQLQQQQQLSEKVNQSISTEKQMGVDTRGNKYVIIKAPPNTVVMGNSSEPNKVAQRPPQQHLPESFNTTKQRKPRQTAGTGKKTVKSPLPRISPLPVHSPLPQTPPLPVQLSLSHERIHTNPGQIMETFTNETVPPPPAAPAMPVKKGRGRPPKPKPEVFPQAKESASKALKSNGKRSSGSICEPVRQRATRSTAANKNNKLMPYSEIQQSVGNDFIPTTIYSTTHQQSQSVSFMTTQQSIRSSASPIMCTSSMQFQMPPSSLSPQIMPHVMSCIPTERSDGPGVGYAVPSLPVPGYPQTFLLCELIDKKYREVSSRPLYLSADRTRFVEVPDEFLTEAHRKLTDCQREPNPDVLQVISSGAPHVLQPRVVQMHHEQQHQQHANLEDDVKSNDIQMQDPEQLSVDEQASALLCLQQQIVQEQLAQEQFIQQQHQQQQHQIDADDGFLQVATIETEEVQDNLIQHLDAENVVMEEEPIDSTQQVILNIGEQQLILDENSFLNLIGQRSASRNSYTLTPEAIQELVNTCNPTNAITAGGEYNVEICEQQEIVMHGNMLHSADASSDILTVALDDSGLYSEDQFINSEEILQIETPEGLRYIGTATRNAGIIFQSMSTQIQAKTSETNVLLNQAPKMSIEEIPSDKSKPTFETHPSTTATLEDCLSAIGVPPAVPTSLELPASVTNPAIVAKTRTPTPGTIAMNEIIPSGLCHHPDISSLPSMGTNEQELNYDFFTSSTSTHNDKVHANEESVIPDMGEYAVVSSGGNFDDPAR